MPTLPAEGDVSSEVIETIGQLGSVRLMRLAILTATLLDVDEARAAYRAIRQIVNMEEALREVLCTPDLALALRRRGGLKS